MSTDFKTKANLPKGNLLTNFTRNPSARISIYKKFNDPRLALKGCGPIFSIFNSTRAGCTRHRCEKKFMAAVVAKIASMQRNKRGVFLYIRLPNNSNSCAKGKLKIRKNTTCFNETETRTGGTTPTELKQFPKKLLSTTGVLSAKHVKLNTG